MTTTINLLPWREERRKRQQQEFIVLLVVAAVVGALLFFGWKSVVDQQIADQRARNSHIQSKTAELNEKIKEIKELQARRDELVARMEVIQNLQG
ncbi:PilN domain-containing protein, partial [Alcanivorax sp. HI0044]|uniref:PilN domain-containing protein n=3 Tax=Alcanivorax TaxID=59753 RepID=UPI000AD1ACCF